MSEKSFQIIWVHTQLTCENNWCFQWELSNIYFVCVWFLFVLGNAFELRRGDEGYGYRHRCCTCRCIGVVELQQEHKEQNRYSKCTRNSSTCKVVEIAQREHAYSTGGNSSRMRVRSKVFCSSICFNVNINFHIQLLLKVRSPRALNI